MYCSANELFHIVRKALLCCGINHDIAEDVGYGCLMVQMLGGNCLPELCDTLLHFANNSADDPPSTPQAITVREQQLHLDSGGGALLLHGATLGDWLVAHPERPSVLLKTDRLAEFFIGQLLFQSYQYGGKVTIQAFQASHTSLTADIWQADELIGKPLSGLLRLSYYESLAATAAVTDVRWVHSEVDEVAWQQLTVFAHRTYVPQSQQSRLLGAGAGLCDND